MPLSPLLRDARRRVGLALASTFTRGWASQSKLFLVGEGVDWSIDRDLYELASMARRLGIDLAPQRFLNATSGQAAFYGSQFSLLREPWRPPRHRLATAYFHGRPGTPGYPEFDACFRALSAHHEELARVQVSHSEIHDLVLESGIAVEKVCRIPIGVDLDVFPPQTEASLVEARARFDLPRDAFVVGSFQKDGVGLAEGLEPKWIKGPDVLLDTVAQLAPRVPSLHVLLTGPARGYVCTGLERLGIPYRHSILAADRLGVAYAALDAYVVASRQEGGPKGVLEAMASGVPLVTTRVGQAMDLVEHEVNGWMVDVDDAEGLAYWLERLAEDAALRLTVVAAGRSTAVANSYRALEPAWQAFLEALVRVPASS